MDGKIDMVREALETIIAYDTEYKCDLITHEPDYEHPIDGGCGIFARKALAALSAIDLDAIRRECAEKICALDAKLPAMRRSSYQEGYGDALDDAEAAILSAEPARDDGKPEVGDVVYHEGRVRAWDCADEEMRDEYCNKVIVIMRAAEVKRRLEEAEE